MVEKPADAAGRLQADQLLAGLTASQGGATHVNTCATHIDSPPSRDRRSFGRTVGVLTGVIALGGAMPFG